MIAQPTLLKAFRVARELGKHPDEILDHYSALGLNTWMAYLDLTPEDFQARAETQVDQQARSFFRALRDTESKG